MKPLREEIWYPGSDNIAKLTAAEISNEIWIVIWTRVSEITDNTADNIVSEIQEVYWRNNEISSR